mmetsp:Transcript_26187/g.61094  ORF Transcript_26187/g.61094 Transcript_26187/m.61094 type:complete len:544 (-) Transcript_26187:149-1780(-)
MPSRCEQRQAAWRLQRWALQLAALQLGPFATASVSAEAHDTTPDNEQLGMLEGTTTTLQPASTTLASEQEEAVFKSFRQNYGIHYQDAATELHHEDDFVKNYRFIEEFNAKGKSCTLKISEVADLNLTEFQHGHFGLKPEAIEEAESRRLGFGDPDLQHVPSRSLEELPSSVDWEEAGAVTEIKNQKSCGSCYSFATIAALEGAWQIKTGQLIDMSNQQVVDCTYQMGPTPHNMGCGGGYLSTSFKYMKDDGICTWDSFPYDPPSGAVGSCSRKDTCQQAVLSGYVVSYRWVSRGDMTALMEALAQQPVAVAVAASSMAFQLYGSGIITADECGSQVDHAVLLIGYGTDSGLDYWRLKNSWGTSWGEDGFFRIERGAGGQGSCGILVQPAYPVISDAATINDETSDNNNGDNSGGGGGGNTGDSTTQGAGDGSHGSGENTGGTEDDGDDDDDDNHSGFLWNFLTLILIVAIGICLVVAVCSCAGAFVSSWRGNKRGYQGEVVPTGSDYWDAPYGADPSSQYPSYGYPPPTAPQQHSPMVPYSY